MEEKVVFSYEVTWSDVYDMLDEEQKEKFDSLTEDRKLAVINTLSENRTYLDGLFFSLSQTANDALKDLSNIVDEEMDAARL